MPAFGPGSHAWINRRVFAGMAMAFLIVPRVAVGQDRLDRNPLIFPEPRLAPGQRLLAKNEQAAAVWALQPAYSTLKDTQIPGISLSFKNNSLIGAVPIKLSVADKVVTTESARSNRFLLNGVLDPDMTSVNKRLSLEIAGQYSRAERVSTDNEGSIELDCAVDNKSNVQLGGIAYYDGHSPETGSSTNGSTFAFDGLWSPDAKAALYVEHDFKSDFAGEDNTLAIASRQILDLPRTSIGLGVQKHGLVSIQVKIGYDQLSTKRQHDSGSARH